MTHRSPEQRCWDWGGLSISVLGGALFLLMGMWGGDPVAAVGGNPEADTLSASSGLPIEQVRRIREHTFSPVQVGDTVMVRGRASAGTGALPDSSLIFVQDETAGIAVQLPDGPAVNRGDSLWVRGVIRHRFGLTRLQGLDYARVDAMMRFPTPVPLTVSGAAGEPYEGRLVRVRGEVVVNRRNKGGRYLIVEDEIQSTDARIAVFVPSRRLDEIGLAAFETGDRVDIAGVLSQHDQSPPYRDDYQVLPRDQLDLEHGDQVPGEYQTVILLIIGGALLAVIAVLTLRSMVRRRTQQLTESRARFRRLAESTSEGIILHRDGEIRDVNRALTEMTGYERDELEGRAFEAVLSESTREPAEVDFQDDGRDLYETVVVRQDGSSFPAEIEEREVGVKQGRVRVVALRNVTERKRRERELLLAKEEAEQMARLKSSLLNNMSHEFRTPITSILGYAELILEEPDADHQSFARHIRQSGHRLSRTLRTVLEMAQLEADSIDVSPKVVDVGALARDVTGEHRALAAEKGLAIDVSVPSECMLKTDRRLLRRVLDNLVHNAVKFTQEGHVQVEVDPHDSETQISVSDTGVGIDPTFQSHLFEPFTQESEGRTRTHEGTGLGLALTKRMTNLLGGSIEVDSRQGEGSTFVVHIPHLSVPGEATAASGDMPSSKDRSKMKTGF